MIVLAWTTERRCRKINGHLYTLLNKIIWKSEEIPKQWNYYGSENFMEKVFANFAIWQLAQ